MEFGRCSCPVHRRISNIFFSSEMEIIVELTVSFVGIVWNSLYFSIKTFILDSQSYLCDHSPFCCIELQDQSNHTSWRRKIKVFLLRCFRKSIFSYFLASSQFSCWIRMRTDVWCPSVPSWYNQNVCKTILLIFVINCCWYLGFQFEVLIGMLSTTHLFINIDVCKLVKAQLPFHSHPTCSEAFPLQCWDPPWPSAPIGPSTRPTSDSSHQKLRSIMSGLH